MFAAGADINEMAQTDAIGALLDVRSQYWKTIANFSKPLLAAVNGDVAPTSGQRKHQAGRGAGRDFS